MRTRYKNRDEILLTYCGCDGCSPSMVNGSLCHERACPDAWRDQCNECKWCGTKFVPEYSAQAFCVETCHCAYFGLAGSEA